MVGWRAYVGSALVVLLAACSGKETTPAGGGTPGTGAPAPDPGAAADTKIIMEFADQQRTVKDLNKYFEANLYVDGGLEDISPGDVKLLQSRLFDSFVDEELLMHEAKLAGIQVSPEEIEAYAQATVGEEVEDARMEAIRRDMARKDLTIQKLRSTWVQANVKVTPAEIAQYVTEHRRELEPERSVLLRSAMFPSEEKAKAVSADVAARKLTFDQALDTPGVNKSQAQPSRVTLDSLPSEVRDAVEKLEEGQVSAPVTVNGRPFLFYVVSWVKPAGNLEESLRERAEATLLAQKQEDASRSQVFGARQRVPTKLHLENLPFEYIPSE